VLNLGFPRVNRGVAILDNTVFVGTLDGYLFALDAKAGIERWSVHVGDNPTGHSITAAPLVVDDKVIVGISGGEAGIRGFLDAYDAKTGKPLWRFFTVPSPGEPGSESWPGDSWVHGGGATWLTGSYDPALKLLYWGTGNPGPDWNGDMRKGDNLYTSSLVALDVETGKARWHFQFTPHDTHDWDANEVPVLADIAVNGRSRKVVMMANRNGFFYVNDRITGEFIRARPFVQTTWSSEIGRDGRPVLNPGQEPTEAGTVTCPGLYGGTNFMSPSFDAKRGLFFVTARETCMRYIRRPPAANTGLGALTLGGNASLVSEPVKSSGALRAIDPTTGERKWEITYGDAGWAGVLATAGGVVFSGDHEGTFFAADSVTGKKLFQFQTGAQIFAPPTSYMIDGRQWVVIPSGTTITAFTLPKVTYTLEN
jgi:alcohol dehydrogenase (cytochrome c)